MKGRIWYCRKAGDIVGIKVPQYRWAKTIKELDGNKCAFCGSIERIEAHHIQQKAEAEAVSTDLENGITLCHKCHYTAHGADFTTNHRKIPDWRGLFTTEPEIMQAFIADYAAQKVVIAVPKGRKEEIQAFAAQTGESVNGFINRAIDEKVTAGQHNRIAKRPGRFAPVSFSQRNFAQSDKKMALSRFTVYAHLTIYTGFTVYYCLLLHGLPCSHYVL